MGKSAQFLYLAQVVAWVCLLTGCTSPLPDDNPPKRSVNFENRSPQNMITSLPPLDPLALANCAVLTDTVALCMKTYGQGGLAADMQERFESLHDALLDQVGLAEANRLKDQATAGLISAQSNLCDQVANMDSDLALCTDLLSLLLPDDEERVLPEVPRWRRSRSTFFF